LPDNPKREFEVVTSALDVRPVNGPRVKFDTAQRCQVHVHGCEAIQQYGQLTVRLATLASFFA
jgi:hypothetical protein